MSKDLKLRHLCSHQVVSEWLSLESDLQTLIPNRNPMSKGVKIFWNALEVPEQGLKSNVVILGAKGPFNLETGSTEFKYKLGGEPYTISLPQGQSSAEDIALALSKGYGIRASVNKGRISVESSEAGSVSILLDGGSAHPVLGFPSRRMYSGSVLVPSWKLVRNSNSVDNQARIIKFDFPLKTDDDLIEMSYFVRRSDCRRCQGTGIENDMRYAAGKPVMVRDTNLMVQEVEKILFTITGSNVYHTWYGTSISEMIGSKITGISSYFEARILSEIGAALDRYKDTKTQQSRFQEVSKKELLATIRHLEVKQDERDPTIVRIRIGLQNSAREIEELEETLIINDAQEFGSFRFRE